MRRVVLVSMLLAAGARADAEFTKQVRRTLAKVLAEPDEGKRRALVAPLADGARVRDVAAAMRRGPLLPGDARVERRGETFTTVGTTTVGFSFRWDGARYVYAVDVPRGYDPGTPAPVLLDPGHAILRGKSDREKAGALGFYRRMLDRAGCEGWLVVRSHVVEEIGADGKDRPEEYGSRVFQELFRDLVTRFHVDPDRIYCAGLSQTGFWTWMLGRARADRFAGLAPMGAVVWEAQRYPANYLNLPVFVLHGEKDGTCPVGPVRTFLPLLARHGVPVRYLEIEGAGHDGSVWSALPKALEHLRRTSRVRYPARVSKGLSALHDGWSSWLRIDAVRREGGGRAKDPPKAAIDAERDGQSFRLWSEGVTRVTLHFAEETADVDRPVVVQWNGRTVHQGKLTADVFTLFETAYEKSDWTAMYSAKLALKAP